MKPAKRRPRAELQAEADANFAFYNNPEPDVPYCCPLDHPPPKPDDDEINPFRHIPIKNGILYGRRPQPADADIDMDPCEFREMQFDNDESEEE